MTQPEQPLLPSLPRLFQLKGQQRPQEKDMLSNVQMRPRSMTLRPPWIGPSGIKEWPMGYYAQTIPAHTSEVAYPLVARISG